MSQPLNPSLTELRSLVAQLRPKQPDDIQSARRYMLAEAARLRENPAECRQLAAQLYTILALPRQSAFYAESGIRSALGFWLEVSQRISQRLLPPVADRDRLGPIVEAVFAPHDHEWVTAVPDEAWLELFLAIGSHFGPDEIHPMRQNLLDAIRILSYRLAGVALDQELLRAAPALEEAQSPFLIQNAHIASILEHIEQNGLLCSTEPIAALDLQLTHCEALIAQIRQQAGEHGTSIRLTYQLARLQQLIERLRLLLAPLQGQAGLMALIRLMKTLLHAEQTSHRLLPFIGDNIALLARNVTDCASRHGEHYIATSRAAWWGMARSAAGGGIVIALMALCKLRLALLHLPPLTEAIAFSLNYGIGFILIHMLGLTVATKQPAMTAASIAATVEEAHPRELDRLGDLVQSVIRTQFIAVLGNVGLALPVACLLAWLWPMLFATPIAPAEKITHLLTDVHPWHSGALFYAAVAGVGLFLSGLVSGFFDNKARYHQLAQRLCHAPLLNLFGPRRAQRIACYIDEHLGAILGNLFFGFYLGMTGALSVLTGLPVDIRHVAFSSANLGTALMAQAWSATLPMLPWAVAGILGIALINLLVSFSLALFVAMKSRQLGASSLWRLGGHVLRHLIRHPLGFILPPRT